MKYNGLYYDNKNYFAFKKENLLNIFIKFFFFFTTNYNEA